MSISRRSVSILLAGSLMGTSVAARDTFASPTTETDAEAPQDADALAVAHARYAAGAEAYARGDYDTALVEFQASHAAVPAPRVLFSIGLCRHALGDWRGASAALRRYLEEGGAAVPGDLREQAEGLLAEISAEMGRVAIEVGQAGAEVLVDGELVGLSPLPAPVELEPGEHVIEARLDGFRAGSATVTVRSGEQAALAIALVPRPALLRVETGAVVATLFVDGREAGRSGSMIELASGSHELRIEADGFDAVTRSVELQPGATESLTVALSRTAAPAPQPVEEDQGIGARYWWVWTTIGVVVVGGAVATGVLLWPEGDVAADWQWRMR